MGTEPDIFSFIVEIGDDPSLYAESITLKNVDFCKVFFGVPFYSFFSLFLYPPGSFFGRAITFAINYEPVGFMYKSVNGGRFAAYRENWHSNQDQRCHFSTEHLNITYLSTTAAIPIPPPMHSVPRPVLASLFSIS